MTAGLLRRIFGQKDPPPPADEKKSAEHVAILDDIKRKQAELRRVSQKALDAIDDFAGDMTHEPRRLNGKGHR